MLSQGRVIKEAKYCKELALNVLKIKYETEKMKQGGNGGLNFSVYAHAGH